MKSEIKIKSNQGEPKSILDLTPYELAQIDASQNRNRGFVDDEDEYLESWFNWEGIENDR